MGNIIELKDIKKKFGKQVVLHGLNFVVPEGKITCLLGPSGCGKTTLIRIITGGVVQDSGVRRVFGDEKVSFGTLAKVGYMPQTLAVYDNMTGRENLEFFGGIGGLKGNALAARIGELASLLHLGNALEKVVGKYSGGMKRRLSLGIAMMFSPELLILDEPTVGVDPILRESIWEELRYLADNGTTILITTHTMDEVERCNYAGLMRGGRILAYGTPSEIIESSGENTMEAAFIKYSKAQLGRYNSADLFDIDDETGEGGVHNE